MRQYDDDEALLWAWEEKLKKIPDTNKKDKDHKSELLTIFTKTSDSAASRLKVFNKEKTALLTEFKKDDWPPFIAWFVSFFRSLFGSEEPQHLRKALEEETTIKKVDLLSSSKKQTENGQASATSLNYEAYEEALFTDPQKAFADLQGRIKSFTSDENLKEILDRLHAIRYRLTSGTYQELLSELYEKAPVETLSYCYDRYTKDPTLEVDDAYQFIEHELMNRTLINLFISPIKNQNARCEAIQRLLLLLALSGFSNPPLKELLAKTTSDQIKNNEKMLSDNLQATAAKDGQPKPIYIQGRDLIHDLWKKEHDGALLSENVLKSPFKMLKISTKTFYKTPSTDKNPLFQSFAKLACQELFLNYYNPEFNKPSANQVNLTIELLSGKILGTWEGKIGEKIKLVAEEIFRPFHANSKVPPQYKKAVFHANEIILQTLVGDIKNEATQEKIIETAKKIKDQDLKPHELTWISSAIEWALPKDLATKVKTILARPDDSMTSMMTKMPKTTSTEAVKKEQVPPKNGEESDSNTDVDREDDKEGKKYSIF